jgi:hypothetical protein
LRQSKIESLKNNNLTSENTFQGQRVIIAADGGRSKIRINKSDDKNEKTNRYGFDGIWVEPKLLTIYVVDEQGKKIKNNEIPITNDGTYHGYKPFLEILEIYLVSLGINSSKQVLLIADGESSWRCRLPSRLSLSKTNWRTRRAPSGYGYIFLRF